jgi:uncharacterized phage protein (TIGR01671 family)
MREIKFRAWDKINKKMMKEDDFANKEIVLNFNGNIFQLIVDEHLAIDYKIKTENYELMQYTGLKDKNGVNIFESDILNIGEPGHASKEVVVFKKGCFGINASWVINNESKFIPLKEYCNDVFINCVEKIGNIYENLERLK